MKEWIIYEDNVLLVANKPSGLPSQGTENPKKEHFYGLLKKYLDARDKRDVYLAIHHRLDAMTSGLMIFSKSKNHNKKFTDLFRDHKIEKTYLAKVHLSDGSQIAEEFEVSNQLKAVKRGNFKISIVDKKGDEALTHFRLIKKEAATAILECHPKTGRMHQIRVHLADKNLPIVGDFVYGKDSKSNAFHLHAWKLKFSHPLNDQIVEYIAPISWA